MASLLYRESFIPEVIIIVPSGGRTIDATQGNDKNEKNEKKNIVVEKDECIDIYQFSSKYCVSDSSEDEGMEENNIYLSLQNKRTCTSSTVSTVSRSVSSSESSPIIKRTSETLTCNVVECSIGNRTFHFSVRTGTGTLQRGCEGRGE